MTPEGTVHWLALALLPGLGASQARRLALRFGGPGEAAYRAPVQEIGAAVRLRRGAAERIVEARRDLRPRVEAEIAACRRLGIRLIALDDPEYPSAWEELPDPPLIVYARGSLREAVVRVAVVGSRRATAYGRRVAAGLAGGLAARGVEIVSGGARGIDSCAHLGALESGGRTVAILGSGFLRPYPPENDALFGRISESGAILSEFPLEEPPLAGHFPRRNRLISGLSAAVVVVEAAERSGSLVTAAHALEQGREVMAVPGPVSYAQSRGCHRLIQQGAKLVQEVQDVLDELSPMYAAALAPASPAAGGPEERGVENLPPDERAVLALLDEAEPVHLDSLADRAPFGIARLQAALFALEFRGAVEQLEGRYYLARLRRET